MREAQRGPAPSQPWANWGEKRTQRQEMKTGILVHSGRCDKKKTSTGHRKQHTVISHSSHGSLGTARSW